MFIFVLFKHNITERTVDFSGIQTRIVGVEGKHAYQLTTTTALLNCLLLQTLRTKSETVILLFVSKMHGEVLSHQDRMELYLENIFSKTCLKLKLTNAIFKLQKSK